MSKEQMRNRLVEIVRDVDPEKRTEMQSRLLKAIDQKEETTSPETRKAFDKSWQAMLDSVDGRIHWLNLKGEFGYNFAVKEELEPNSRKFLSKTIIEQAKQIEEEEPGSFVLRFPFFVASIFSLSKIDAFAPLHPDQIRLKPGDGRIVFEAVLREDASDNSAEKKAPDIRESLHEYDTNPQNRLVNDFVKEWLVRAESTEMKLISQEIQDLWKQRDQMSSEDFRTLTILLSAPETAYQALTQAYVDMYLQVIRELKKDRSQHSPDSKQEMPPEIQRLEERRANFHRGIEAFAQFMLHGTEKSKVRDDLESLCRYAESLEAGIETEEIIPGLSFQLNTRFSKEGILELVLGSQWGEDGYNEDTPRFTSGSELYVHGEEEGSLKYEKFQKFLRELRKAIIDVCPSVADTIDVQYCPPATHYDPQLIGLTFEIANVRRAALDQGISTQELLSKIYASVRQVFQEHKIHFDQAAWDNRQQFEEEEPW